jgi:monofunctional biosynthetic peptidoglycan transglycosylase
LNVAEWGRGIYGIEAASRHYYGKASLALTPEESARLAAVLPQPRKYSPIGSQRYVLHRSELIYDIMVRRGRDSEYEERQGEPRGQMGFQSRGQ